MIPKIRVRIAQGLEKVVISGTDIIQNVFKKQTKTSIPGRRIFEFDCISKSGFKFPEHPIELFSLSSPTGIIKWEKKTYNGDFTVITSSQNQCDLVNSLDLEDYIPSLLANEMNAAWPIEALKAQAVAARTYALHKIKTNQVSKNMGFESFYHLEDSEKHQVYGSFHDQTPNTAKATKQTRGEVLISADGGLAPIFFHAKCGGRTLVPEMVWQSEVAGYREVDCPYCHSHGPKTWDKSFSKKEFREVVNTVLNTYYAEEMKSSAKMMMVPDEKYSREITVLRGGRKLKLKKSYFRKVLGRREIKSNNFKIDLSDGRVKLVGDGLGHGVGLCQYGALELAKRGHNYKQILSHYFPEHVLKKEY